MTRRFRSLASRINEFVKSQGKRNPIQKWEGESVELVDGVFKNKSHFHDIMVRLSLIFFVLENFKALRFIVKELNLTRILEYDRHLSIFCIETVLIVFTYSGYMFQVEGVLTS